VNADARRPVVLAGYFGFGNAGDELLRAVLTRQARAVDWTVLSARPSPGTGEVRRWDPLAVLSALRRGRGLLFGGGEIFQVRTSRASLLYYAALGRAARLLGRPVGAYALGVEPHLPAWAGSAVRGVFRGSRVLFARDEDSARALSAGPAFPAVVPDPVWAWPVADVPPPERLSRVLWILRFPDDPPREADAWADRLNALARAEPWEHGFLALHPELDGPALTRLRRRLDFFHRLETWREPEDVFAAVARYDLVVSMRFHGVIAARLARRPAVAVAAHAKVRRAAEEAGVPVAEAGADLGRVVRGAFDSGTWRDPSRVAALAGRARTGLRDLERAILDGWGRD
jgi:polysaccharide pyruvyl transferase CsaB